MTEINPNETPIIDEIDTAILMHRDVHYGGNFNVMIEYYQNDGKGVMPEFRQERIFELAKMELSLGQNLASFIISGADLEKVKLAKETYQQLKSICHTKNEKIKTPRLIADLILTEEFEPVDEMQAIVNEGKKIVPSLVELMRSEIFRDPLFPGYGKAPHHALVCLGLMKDADTITSIFEMIGRDEVMEEEVAIEVLRKIGKPAMEFLLRIVKSLPITEDNERAAIALIQFKNQPEVTKNALNLLSTPKYSKIIPLSQYLALCCEGLKSSKDRESFAELENDPEIPKPLKEEIRLISKAWKK